MSGPVPFPAAIPGSLAEAQGEYYEAAAMRRYTDALTNALRLVIGAITGGETVKRPSETRYRQEFGESFVLFLSSHLPQEEMAGAKLKVREQVSELARHIRSLKQKHDAVLGELADVAGAAAAGHGLSQAELGVLALTANLWNELHALGEHLPFDLAEHLRDIHDIQQRVMARLARRAHPSFFRQPTGARDPQS